MDKLRSFSFFFSIQRNNFLLARLTGSDEARGRRSLWVVPGHRRWCTSHRLLKCQSKSWNSYQEWRALASYINYISVVCFLPGVHAEHHHWVNTRPMVTINSLNFQLRSSLSLGSQHPLLSVNYQCNISAVRNFFFLSYAIENWVNSDNIFGTNIKISHDFFK